MQLTDRDRERLVGVHPQLVHVVELAAQYTPTPFGITEGVRSRERQAQMVASGASQTMDSRHLTGHAIDFVAIEHGQISWAWPLYHNIARAFRQAANQLGIWIVCGADWRNFPDGPHIELCRHAYPPTDKR